ncbi:MAG: [Clostridia bacterium]|nr:[FeFe] hydrogenase H-cluster maturation GTPase HydF [Clostridia bacterium]
MGLNEVASGERLHIGFFGMRNAGKSSLVNAVTGQELSVVSDVKGTTTDPVQKAMELLPLGPVVVIDTPGLDDAGELGRLRVQKAKQVLTRTDVAVLVVDGLRGIAAEDLALIEAFKERRIPYVIACNKADLLLERPQDGEQMLYVSALTGEGVRQLKERLGAFARTAQGPKYLVRDLIAPGDAVVLVTPIDEAAPRGRLILPQQMTIRDILDAHGMVVTCQDTELKQTLDSLAVKPRMVITDSQVFGKVSKDAPGDVWLTSFSILMARYKGDLKTLVRGASLLGTLRTGDRVLISEGCTHHRQCNDIGTVKLPGWIEQFCGAKPEFTFTSGQEFPEDLSGYRLVVHCGGCMLNETAMKHRIHQAVAKGIPIVNYGIAIAHMNGILRRSVEPFSEIVSILDEKS